LNENAGAVAIVVQASGIPAWSATAYSNLTAAWLRSAGSSANSTLSSVPLILVGITTTGAPISGAVWSISIVAQYIGTSKILVGSVTGTAPTSIIPSARSLVSRLSAAMSFATATTGASASKSVHSVSPT